MIGLPGHFLLATRPQPPSHERVFVDVFHGGQLLTLDHCEAIVRSYNVPWSEEMARPASVSSCSALSGANPGTRRSCATAAASSIE